MSKLTDALAAWGLIKNETRRNANTATRIGDAGLAILAEVQERVSVNEQALTDAQKLQARANIGAGVPVNLSTKADLVNGKVPTAQLPDDKILIDPTYGDAAKFLNQKGEFVTLDVPAPEGGWNVDLSNIIPYSGAAIEAYQNFSNIDFSNFDFVSGSGLLVGNVLSGCQFTRCKFNLDKMLFDGGGQPNSVSVDYAMFNECEFISDGSYLDAYYALTGWDGSLGLNLNYANYPILFNNCRFDLPAYVIAESEANNNAANPAFFVLFEQRFASFDDGAPDIIIQNDMNDSFNGAYDFTYYGGIANKLS